MQSMAKQSPKTEVKPPDPLLNEMKVRPEEIAAPKDQPKHDPADFDPPGDPPAEPGADQPSDPPAEPGAEQPSDPPADPPGSEPGGEQLDDDDALAQAQRDKDAEPITDSEAERDAEFYIGVLDSLQTLILPGLYKGTMLSRKERIQIRQLLQKYKLLGKRIVAAELDAEDRLLLEKYDDIEALADIVPFTDEEVENIKGPLAEVLIKYNLKGSPEMRLIMALSVPMAQRMAPLLSLAI